MPVFAVPSWGCSGLEIREKQNQFSLVAMLSPFWLANASWPGATVDFWEKARRTFADFTTREVRRFRTWLRSLLASGNANGRMVRKRPVGTNGSANMRFRKV